MFETQGARAERNPIPYHEGISLYHILQTLDRDVVSISSSGVRGGDEGLVAAEAAKVDVPLQLR